MFVLCQKLHIWAYDQHFPGDPRFFKDPDPTGPRGGTCENLPLRWSEWHKCMLSTLSCCQQKEVSNFTTSCYTWSFRDSQVPSFLLHDAYAMHIHSADYATANWLTVKAGFLSKQLSGSSWYSVQKLPLSAYPTHPIIWKTRVLYIAWQWWISLLLTANWAI